MRLDEKMSSIVSNEFDGWTYIGDKLRTDDDKVLRGNESWFEYS
jgi:hypothetical protein